MNIVIDDEVVNSLKLRRKNVITIDYGVLSSCWSIMPEIFVRLKNPVDLDKFQRYEKDNFEIYINKELIIKNEVRIKLPEYVSDLSDKEFEVVGVSLKR